MVLAASGGGAGAGAAGNGAVGLGVMGIALFATEASDCDGKTAVIHSFNHHCCQHLPSFHCLYTQRPSQEEAKK